MKGVMMHCPARFLKWVLHLMMPIADGGGVMLTMSRVPGSSLAASTGGDALPCELSEMGPSSRDADSARWD